MRSFQISMAGYWLATEAANCEWAADYCATGHRCARMAPERSRALRNNAASVPDLGVMLSIRNPDEGRCKMADEINVHVAGYGAGRNLMLRYSDPLTGKRVAKSAGTRNRREAEREAGK